MSPGLEEVALCIKCSVGPRSIIPPDHWNHVLPGCSLYGPCVPCYCVWGMTLWPCWWVGLAPGLSGCNAWLWLLHSCTPRWEPSSLSLFFLWALYNVYIGPLWWYPFTPLSYFIHFSFCTSDWTNSFALSLSSLILSSTDLIWHWTPLLNFSV